MITPPPELVGQWMTEIADLELLTPSSLDYLATQAANWGADQELEACEKYWMTHGISPQGVVAMRYARRPQPPSLKEQALDALNLMLMFVPPGNQLEQGDTIRRALEALPND